ncbi:MAG: glycosyltransferase, partial [Chloroflexota bacterium]
MHIAINGWFWNQPDTGSGQYVRELLRALRQIDKANDYTLVIPGHKNTPDNVPDGVNIITTGSSPDSKPGKVWFEQQQFPAAVRRSNADIAHVPYWGPPLSSPAKLVTSVLDVIPLLYPEYSGGIMTRLYTSMVKAAAQGSAYVITLSEASKTDVAAQLPFPPERVIPIHLAPKEAYHPKMGAERDPDVAKKYNLPEDPFIFYIGGFDARKQLDQLFAAYTYVVQAHGEY